MQYFNPVLRPGLLLVGLIGIPIPKRGSGLENQVSQWSMAPGRSELALNYELNTRASASLLHIGGAYVFLTRKCFIIHRLCEGDVNASQL